MQPLRIIPPSTPSPQLFSTAVTKVVKLPATRNDAPSRFRLTSGGFFDARFRSTIFALVLAAGTLGALGYLAEHYRQAEQEFEMLRRFVAVRTNAVVPPKQMQMTDAKTPVRLNLSPELLRVTAIALGHPRLAIINGKQVTEGDSLTVKGPSGLFEIVLHVVRISDGSIDLTDGSAIITTHMPPNGSPVASR